MFDVRLRRILLLKVPTVVMLPLPSCLRFRLRTSLRSLEDSVVNRENDDADSQKHPQYNHDGERDVGSVIVPGHLGNVYHGWTWRAIFTRFETSMLLILLTRVNYRPQTGHVTGLTPCQMQPLNDR
jgi:hypothetical protein